MSNDMKQILIFSGGSGVVGGIMCLGSPLIALYCFAVAGVLFYFAGRSK